MKKSFIIAFLSLFVSYGFLSAENISEKIRLNGFLSQGYVYTTDNDFIPNSGEKGSFELNEFGLSISVDVTEKLHFGFLVFARDFGPIDNHNIKLDWGYADYRFSDAFGIRIGKIKSPVGFFNEVRDTDALHSLAILPQSIYDESMRPVLVAYQGLGLYGNLDTGIFGDFDYNLFAGSVNHPKDAAYMELVQFATNLVVVPMGLFASEIDMDSETFYGGRLTWNTPLRGLRLGGTYVYHKGKIAATIFDPLSGPFPMYGSMELTNCFFLSGELALGDLTITSEYMEMLPHIEMDVFGQEAVLSHENMQGWYIMGSYIFGDKLTLTLLYDQFYMHKDDKKGDLAVAQGNPRFFGWQKDITVGLRYDVNFNWTIKLEWHRIDGLGKSWIFSDPADYRQKWNMIVAKCSFNF